MRLIFKLLLTILLFIPTGRNTQLTRGQLPDSTSKSTYTINQSNKNQNEKSKSEKLISELKNSLNSVKESKDTIKTIWTLIKLSDAQNNEGKFSLSFDHLWEAQYLTNQIKNHRLEIIVQIRLGRLYDYFEMEEKSLHHFHNALQTSKEVYKKDKSKTGNLISSFMNIATRHRKSGNYNIALTYLDSCLIYQRNLKTNLYEMPFWDAERGYIHLKLGNIQKAKKHLQQALKNTDEKKMPFSTNINMYLGDYYTSVNRPDSAIFHYRRGLNSIRHRNFNIELEAKILKRLSKIFYSTGKKQRAYNFLSQASTVTDSLTRLKNKTNSELFEIKNTYLKSISRKNELLKAKEITISNKEKTQTQLTIIIFVVIILALVSIFTLRMRLKLKKLILDKKETEMQAKMMEERNNAEIELKSKELTSYTLQIIDKNAAIDELLSVLQQESPLQYKSLQNKFKNGARDMWNEFNMRFTEINSTFYKQLRTKHPSISPTEQKHCALIKLRFSTKEIARLLNIEVHSVHISRSRIRKKLGLTRQENLDAYIEGLS